jgi:hypothetical protein
VIFVWRRIAKNKKVSINECLTEPTAPAGTAQLARKWGRNTAIPASRMRRSIGRSIGKPEKENGSEGLPLAIINIRGTHYGKRVCTRYSK